MSVVAMKVAASFFFFVVIRGALSSPSHLLDVNSGVEVANGRIGYLRSDQLSFRVLPGQICKVRVVENEPMHQRVGKLHPKVFDCNFHARSVRYEHNGSPLLAEDSVKMRAYVLLDNRTLEETFIMKIRIVTSRCDIIRITGKPLEVPEYTRFSNPIDANIVQFHYDRQFKTRCTIRVYRDEERGFPIAGRVVRVVAPTALGRRETVERYDGGTLDIDCDDFLLQNFKYEQLSDRLSPNLDYLPIHVVISDSRSEFILTEERHWFPISLIGRSRNLAPYTTHSPERPTFEVDEFILTNILPNTVSVRDVETVQRKLIYNITRRPQDGFVTNLDDETKHVESFWQKDINAMKIGYHPPNVAYPERQNYDFELTVLDAFFEPSRPFSVGVSVRTTDTNAPRLVWNMGLTLLEGQCRPINHHVLKIIDRDNLDWVRVTLAGGLQHGSLLVDGRPGYTFKWSDLEEGSTVSYCHDDSDTQTDSIVFRLSDIYHSTTFKLPIRILPKDDAPPFLISNLVLQVDEGESVLITRRLLEASDLDSDPSSILFKVVREPEAGEIQKKRKWEKVGWKIGSFPQIDLFKGLITYKHLGGELFQDYFEIVLVDTNQPEPNVSPPLRVNVKISPVDDLPPQPGPGNSLSLRVNETDLFILTPIQLNHFDPEHPEADVEYEVIGGCNNIEQSENRDAGRIISLSDVPMPMKDPSLPSINVFTQKSVNHSRIAYMPPMRGIGLNPERVQFFFVVKSQSGKKLGPHLFNIEVLPVDNQAPSLNLLPLTIREGEETTISAESIFIHDADTGVEDLTIIVDEAPQFGELTLSGVKLTRGSKFDKGDLDRSRVRYRHDGSESMNDQMVLRVSDGLHSSSAFMNIIVEAVDDEMPKIIDGNETLRVEEKGWAVLNTSVLSATDVDTTDNFLVFDVLEYPQQGNIEIGSNPTLRFTQQDIIDGEVKYVHNREIGKDQSYDSFTVMVSDRQPDAATSINMEFAMKKIVVVISPVDDQHPSVLIGEQVLEVDEGGRTLLTVEYLNAEDVDTEVSELSFHITSPPTYGYIEDQTPRKGYEKVIGKPTDSFTYQQLLLNRISYVQSNHSGIEPVSDHFLFYVSDGQHKSIEVSFLISIIPQNDEPPNLICSNLTCKEGSMQELSIHIEDLDVPHDHVMVVVSKVPQHGMLMNEMDHRIKRKRSPINRFSEHQHLMESINEFSMHDLHTRTVVPAYLHDGSENFSDELELTISDGKFEKRKIMMINVLGVNDERPQLLINDGLVTELGESKVISNLVLHAVDHDTSSSDVMYIINVTPRRGSLLVQESDGQWRSLEVADSFSEDDLSMNRVKYKHESVLGSKSQDSFSFHVSDGVLSTRKKIFSIAIRNTKKSAIQVATGTIHVNENARALITTEILTARDGVANGIDDISYRVIAPPLHGDIEYLAFPNLVIDNFSQLDLIAGKVAYVHKSKSDEERDSFRVSVTNRLKSREASVQIEIRPVDRQLPVLTINGRPSSTRAQASTTLYRGSTIVIDDSKINISDSDTSKDKLRLNITQPPEHGTLLVGEKVLARQDAISLNDVTSSHVTYSHNNDRAFVDQFSFVVYDGTNEGFIHNGAKRTGAVTYYLQIEDLDQEPPSVVVNKPAYDFKPSERRKSKSLFLPIDRNVLRSSDRGTTADHELRYDITKKPVYGVVKKKTSRKSEVRRGRLQNCASFTQEDLNRGLLFYVISKKLRVFNDTFLFSVQDRLGNRNAHQRFNLAWSRISVDQTKAKVCKGSKLEIGVRRLGNLDISSFISIAITSKSMRQGRDYNQNFTRQIQFDPGVSYKVWDLWLIDDGLEGLTKRMKIRFSNPVHSVFTSKRKYCKVTVIDSHQRHCKRKERGKKRKLAQDRPIAGIASKHAKVTDTRIYPASSISNGTDRIWTFNAISTITINDGNRDSNYRETPNDQSSAEIREAQPASLLAQLPIPNKKKTSKLASPPKKNNTTSLVRVPKQCVLINKGEIFYDQQAGALLKCNGAEWIKFRSKQQRSSNLCEPGWKSLEKMCVLVSVDTAVTWNEASRNCRESHSASLVIINNKRQLVQLWRMTKQSPFWFGLNRKMNPNKWQWSSGGEKLTYLNWRRNFPKRDDQCAYVGNRKLWKSLPCHQPRQQIKYVCYRPA